MKRHNRYRRPAMRLAACAAGVAVLLTLPVNWSAVGKTASLLAVSLQQPDKAAALLGDQLFPAAPAAPTQTVTTTPAVTQPEEPPVGGETQPETQTSAAALPTPAITVLQPPGEIGNGGRILETCMDTGNRLDAGIATLNRSGTSVDVAAALAREVSIAWEDTDAPQVLILHTHTTEGYMTYDGGYYNEGDRNRTTDHTRNVCAVGEAVRLVLEQAGIRAIHDTTVHDSPVYSGAYTRSADTAAAYLEQYPTIRVVLDLHRDAVMADDTTLTKPTAVVNGKKAAQMMLITGVVSTAALPHPHWEQNLTLAAHLQQALDTLSPDLMRPLNTVASRYNQHLSAGWMLVEVGSEGNTVEEAVYAGQLLGQTLASLLQEKESS